MSESLLKREFKQQDIQRARNLITGKYGDSTQTVVGYSQQQNVNRKEGDTWEEAGKLWMIRDGIKVSVSKLSKARQLVKIPLVCPKCGKTLNTRLDKKFYSLYHICYDCVVKFEDDLKRAGKYKQYEQSIMTGNIEGFARDLQERLAHSVDGSEIKTFSENGDEESWGRLTTGVINSLNEWVDILLDTAKRV